MDKPFYVSLPDRGAITVSGADRRSFLQGLITNDIALLDTQPIVYTCLLTPQGKFLHDFFLSEQNGVITLECEGGARAQDLYTTLKKFRLRSKIDLEVFDIKDVSILMDGKIGSDPRHPALGSRLYILLRREQIFCLPRKNARSAGISRTNCGMPQGFY